MTMYAEGTYKARATSWGWTETTNGNPQFWMGFDVVGLADPNKPDAEPRTCDPGTGRWSITPTTDKSAEWLVSTVQHLGYDRDDLLGLDPDSEGAFDFSGREFLVQARHKEYQGQTRVEWAVYNPKERVKLTSDKLATLNARYGRKVKDMKEKRAAKAAASTDAEAAPF